MIFEFNRQYFSFFFILNTNSNSNFLFYYFISTAFAISIPLARNTRFSWIYVRIHCNLIAPQIISSDFKLKPEISCFFCFENFQFAISNYKCILCNAFYACIRRWWKWYLWCTVQSILKNLVWVVLAHLLIFLRIVFKSRNMSYVKIYVWLNETLWSEAYTVDGHFSIEND